MEVLHVIVGILINKKTEVLISKRANNTHLAGMWEFPGGKLEPGETRHQGLSRELREELGIDVTRAEPLIRIHHQYPERNVLLDVWKVIEYSGQASGCEQQPLQWVLPERLHQYNLPPADRPVLKALSLPEHYVVLDADRQTANALHKQIHNNAKQHCSLFLLRSKALGVEQYDDLARDLIRLARQLNVRLLLNSTAQHVVASGAAGLHLSAQAASCLDYRPLDENYLLGVSCHHSSELAIAEQLNADFALLSPVQHTASHPDTTPLGWEQFSHLLDMVNLPVYALGGLGVTDITQAKRYGAQGVAGISAFQ